MSNLTDQLAGAVRNTERYVRSNPWQAAGALAIVGLAAGFLVTHATRRVRNSAANASSGASEVAGG